MSYSDPALIALAKSQALNVSLDPALVCAVIEQESSWDPWAARYEPAFYDKYVAPHFPGQTHESIFRATSFGLMQLMGENARELGCQAPFLSELFDPATNLGYGCLWLKAKLQKANGDLTKALLLWNGGGNPRYPAEVLARRPKYL